MENIFIDTNIDFEPLPEFIKLTGVMFEDRQNIISQLELNQSVYFERDPFNEHDRYAIKVITSYEGKDVQIGWIPKLTAQSLAPEIDSGIKWSGVVGKIIGGNDKNYGILIKLFLEA